MAQEGKSDSALTADDIARDLRQLALVDRTIGLEAELARIASTTVAPPGAQVEIARLEGEVGRLENELRAVYGSRAWRLGTAALRPVRAIRRVGRSS